MEEEKQKEIGQNVNNDCLCVLWLWDLFLVFYIFDQLICISFKIKKKTLFEREFFLAAAMNVL